MMIPSADMGLMTLAVTVLVFAVRSSAQVVECNMPSVREGQPTAITCDFKEDISNSDNALRVLFLKPTTNVDILDCYKNNPSENYTCDTPAGFSFDNKFGTTLSVQLLDARPQHEGRYACQKVPSASDKFTACNFTLTPEPATTTSTSTSTSTTTASPSDSTGSDESGGNGGAIAGGVIGGGLILALVGVLIWKREALMALIRPKNKANAESKDESGNNIIYKPPKKQPADAEETKEPMVQPENV